MFKCAKIKNKILSRKYNITPKKKKELVQHLCDHKYKHIFHETKLFKLNYLNFKLHNKNIFSFSNN